MGMISVTSINVRRTIPSHKPANISANIFQGTAISLTVIASLLTAGRFVIHWRKNRKLRWDDWFNALALIFLIVMVAIIEIYVPIEYNAILYSKGLSSQPPTELEVLRDMKLNIVTLILFFFMLYSVKASFLALYWQIFEVSRRFRIAWWVLTGYIGVSFIVTLITVFTRCGAAKDFSNIGKSRGLGMTDSYSTIVNITQRYAVRGLERFLWDISLYGAS